MIRTDYPGGGLYVVEGEVSLLITALRRGMRWSSHSHQDENQDVLIKGLSALKEVLNDTKHLSQLEPSEFVCPFLEIIRSEETTGPVTSLALSAIHTIISFGLIDAEHPSIVACVESVADAVTHARFVGTDAAGDGVVLMRILQVLRALVLSQAGDFLSNESICEIMLSCFRICFESRLSELLRKTAEDCLRDVVHHLFIRFPEFTDDTRGVISMKKMRTNSTDNTRNKIRKNKVIVKSKSKTKIEDSDDVEARLFSPIEKVQFGHLATTPVTPSGNIVDMQGSLNQTPDKTEDDKYNRKLHTVRSHLDKDMSELYTSEVSTKSKELVEVMIYGEENDNINCTRDKTENNEPRILLSDGKEDISNDYHHTKEACIKDQPEHEVEKVDEFSINNSSSIDQLRYQNPAPEIKVHSETNEEYRTPKETHVVLDHTPYGSLCVRELFRFLVSLCSPLDKQNTEVMTHLGLRLLQVALSIAADALSSFPSLLTIAKDDLSRHLILLLATERLSLLAVNVHVAFLLFESQREHLKFQMEQYILKLMEIVSSDSNRISYEYRELSLEAIVRLWRIPGLPAELFVNYDCGLYSQNLYEDLMRLLSKSATAVTTSKEPIHSMQLFSLDALFMLIAGIESRCKGYRESLKRSSQSTVSVLPSMDKLLSTKVKKQWLAIGTNQFNENPREGISKLTENGLLGESPNQPDPEKVAKFLRENPGLDKKAIADYISRKDNKDILNCYVSNFDLRNTRIDEALRYYLESFRLPGEAPLISLLLEKFADHWHESNGRPFASSDAAFTLAYAIIMLNVDQHNHNVRRQNNPMTAEQFKKNVAKVNGDADFDQDMLDDIYTSIKNEEIVMPAEHSGLVKENYLWKLLLRRGMGFESTYITIGVSDEYIDKELAKRGWAPIITALCRAYDRAPNRALQRKVAQTFLSCAAISAHYGMTEELDTLIVSLCKFTGFAFGGDPEQISLQLGGSIRCQLATRTLFKITHMYGDAIRGSWRNIVDYLQVLFKAKVLPSNLTNGEDFLEPSGKVSLIRESTTPKTPLVEHSLLSSLYSYIALDSSRLTHPAEATVKKRAIDCIANCHVNLIIDESKFLQVESLCCLVNSLVSTIPEDESISVFLLEVLIDLTIQNRDRVSTFWPVVQAHFDGLLTTAARENEPYLLERITVGMLRLAIRLLHSNEFTCTVLPPLIPLTYLPSASTTPLSQQIAFGLYKLLKTGAANIHSTEDWTVIFSLLECAGAGSLQPKPISSTQEENLSSRMFPLDSRPISPIPEWVLVSPTGTEAPLPVAADTIVLERNLQPHDPESLVKCCECLTFLVKDVAHITPFNFELCVQCIRTFVEAVLCSATKRSRVQIMSEELVLYQQIPFDLLELMHTLHSRTAQIFHWWAQEGETIQEVGSLWSKAWRPLLQGIARLCCDSRKSVRTSAIAYLQSTLLAHDLEQLSAVDWSQCLEQVLFPLLAQLLGPIASNDPMGMEETRVRAAMLLSKVFLHHLAPLCTLPGFLPLWLTVLDLLRSYMHAENSELLFEAIPESLKNMLLVMASAGVLAPDSNLWTPTWRTINSFLPHLENELFPEFLHRTHILPNANIDIPIDPKGSSFEELQAARSHFDDPRLTCNKREDIFVSEALSSSSSDQHVPNSAMVSLSPITTENKELQQVITLVNQLPPCVSNPVAVQPSSDNDLYCSSVEILNDTVEYPTCVDNAAIQRPICSTEHEFPLINNASQRSERLIQKLRIASPQSLETDPTNTTVFNSAAYFSEDPATDRIFVITNP